MALMKNGELKSSSVLFLQNNLSCDRYDNGGLLDREQAAIVLSNTVFL